MACWALYRNFRPWPYILLSPVGSKVNLPLTCPELVEPTVSLSLDPLGLVLDNV